MKDQENIIVKWKKLPWDLWLLLALVLVIVVSVVALVYNVRQAQRQNVLQSRSAVVARLLQKQKNNHINAVDINGIASWMTFGYINTIFHLPADFLRAGLGITDSRYPNLTLSRWARANRISPLQLAARVKQMVAQQLKTQTSNK